jgi:hypothetical protein
MQIKGQGSGKEEEQRNACVPRDRVIRNSQLHAS